MDWAALGLSLKLATWTTLILMPLAVPLAWWVATSRRRWKGVVEAAVAMPLVLPPTVLGLYLLLALGPASPLGRWYEQMRGEPLAFSFEGLVVASVFYSLPFAVQPVAAAFAAVDRRLLEASWVLGASRIETFFRVALPLSWTGVASGFVLAFAHTLGEFGVVLMVGGNIPGVTRTVSIAIYDEVQALNYRAAVDTSLALLAISFALLVILQTWRRRVWAVWSW
jgi:molybdate transport system permease protein